MYRTYVSVYYIECGETSPQPIISHLNRGITKVAIIPFQGQELSSMGAIIFTRSAKWNSDSVQTESTVDLAANVQRASAGFKTLSAEQVTSVPNRSNRSLSQANSRQNLFIDYTNQKRPKTVLAQHSDLELFSRFLHEQDISDSPNADTLQSDPTAWANITDERIDEFVKWQLQEGHAISSINRRLSTLKNYAKLATKAGVLGANQFALIKMMTSYSKTEARRIDRRRTVKRRILTWRLAHLPLSVPR